MLDSQSFFSSFTVSIPLVWSSLSRPWLAQTLNSLKASLLAIEKGLRCGCLQAFGFCSFSIGREGWLEHAVLHGLDEIIVRGALWMRDVFSRRAGWLGTLGATLISLIGNDVIERWLFKIELSIYRTMHCLLRWIEWCLGSICGGYFLSLRWGVRVYNDRGSSVQVTGYDDIWLISQKFRRSRRPERKISVGKWEERCTDAIIFSVSSNLASFVHWWSRAIYKSTSKRNVWKRFPKGYAHHGKPLSWTTWV